MNFETPKLPSGEKRDPFLEKDLHHLNRALSKVFLFTDRSERRALVHKNAAALTPDEAEEAQRRGSPAMAFSSRYGEHVLQRALQGGDGTKPLSPEDQILFEEYRTFLEKMDHPENRPKLLSKMCYLEAGDTTEEQKKSWPERQAFTRFLCEFYGREKVIGEFFDTFTSEDKELRPRGIPARERGFLSLDGQADLVEAWNLAAGWDFTERQFDDIRNEIPVIRERIKEIAEEAYLEALIPPDEHPKVLYSEKPIDLRDETTHREVAKEIEREAEAAREEEYARLIPVITPYLPDKDGTPGYLSTFTALRKLMGVGQEKSESADVYENVTPGDLRLHAKAAPHHSGPTLEILDLGANRGENAVNVRYETSVETLPHAAVLSAAALNPEWIQAMNDVPYVLAAGYDVTPPEDVDQAYDVPIVRFNRDDRMVSLGVQDSGWGYKDTAVPVTRK